jgi:hypothetical protein
VLPGLIDTHIHPIIGAVDSAKCSLAGIKATIDALKPVIQDCLAKHLGGADEWFEAAQLDNYGFSATAKDLDGIDTGKLGMRVRTAIYVSDPNDDSDDAVARLVAASRAAMSIRIFCGPAW